MMTKAQFLALCVAVGFVSWFVFFLINQSNGNDKENVVQGGAETDRMRLLLPLYIYPNTNDYGRAGDAMKILSGRMDIIINPNSGEDAKFPPNSDWRPALNLIKTKAGTSWPARRLHGYIHTKHGKRNLSETKNEMTGYANLWKEWIGNFFFDEVSLNPVYFSFYAELAAHAQKVFPGCKIILNPGVVDNVLGLPVELTTLPGVTSVVVFETGRDNWPFMSKTQPKPASRNGAIVAMSELFDPVNVPEDANFFADVKAKNIGSFFINDMDCKYNKLPPYWDNLVEAIRKN